MNKPAGKKMFGFIYISDKLLQLTIASFQIHCGYIENSVCQDYEVVGDNQNP